jgi:hypothetical protein
MNQSLPNVLYYHDTPGWTEENFRTRSKGVILRSHYVLVKLSGLKCSEGGRQPLPVVAMAARTTASYSSFLLTATRNTRKYFTFHINI